MMGCTSTYCICLELVLLSSLFVSCVSSFNVDAAHAAHNNGVKLAQHSGKCKVTSYYNTPTCEAGSETYMQYHSLPSFVYTEDHACRKGLTLSEGVNSAEVVPSDCGSLVHIEKASMAVVALRVWDSDDCTGEYKVENVSTSCRSYEAWQGGGSIRTYADEMGQWVWHVSYTDSKCEWQHDAISRAPTTVYTVSFIFSVSLISFFLLIFPF